MNALSFGKNGDQKIIEFPNETLLSQRYDDNNRGLNFNYSLLTPRQQEFLLRPEVCEQTWPDFARRSVSITSIDDQDTPLFGVAYVPFLYDSHYTDNSYLDMGNHQYMMQRLKAYVNHESVTSHHISGDNQLLIELDDDSIIGVRFIAGFLYDDFHP